LRRTGRVLMLVDVVAPVVLDVTRPVGGFPVIVTGALQRRRELHGTLRSRP